MLGCLTSSPHYLVLGCVFHPCGLEQFSVSVAEEVAASRSRHNKDETLSELWYLLFGSMCSSTILLFPSTVDINIISSSSEYGIAINATSTLRDPDLGTVVARIGLAVVFVRFTFPVQMCHPNQYAESRQAFYRAEKTKSCARKNRVSLQRVDLPTTGLQAACRRETNKTWQSGENNSHC